MGACYFVYILQNPEGRYYIGLSDNLVRRLEQHNLGVSKWTRGRGPLQDRDRIPPHLSKIVLSGREENIELVCCLQGPNKLNAAVVGQSTEMVSCFLGQSVYLSKVKEVGFDPFEIGRLPLCSVVARSWLVGKLL
jgi:hypothetical protein